MGWVTQLPPIHEGRGHGNGCKLPDSEGGRAFGVWSIWQCDECKVKWQYNGEKPTDGAKWVRYVERSGYRD